MKIYELALDTVRDIAVVNRIIARNDRDLARQLRRCSMSVPLNINEAMYSRGKNRGARLTNAMASTKESVADCLGQLDHLVAALWNMVHCPWRYAPIASYTVGSDPGRCTRGCVRIGT